MKYFNKLKNIVNKKLGKGSEGAIFRNMAKLATGTGIAKVLAVMTTPIITRIYLPEHMGVLSVFVALVGILLPFCTLRYTLAIPLPKNVGTATNLAYLSAISLLFVSLLIFLILLFSGTYLLNALSMGSLQPYWLLIPISVIGAGSYEILSNWAIRVKAFKVIAKTKVWQQVLGSTVKIGAGLLGMKPLGLLMGQVVLEAGGVMSLFRIFREKMRENIRFVTKNRIIFLAKYYSEYPKYRLPSQFLLVLATKMPLLFFAWRYGADTTGQLGLALTMVAVPIGLFGNSTGQAYYAEIAKIGRKFPREIYELTNKLLKKLFIVSLPFFFGIVFFGPILFQLIFGTIWKESGVYVSILALYLLTQFISAPTINVFNVFNKQKTFLVINSLRIILIFAICIVVFYMNYSPKFFLYIYTSVLSLYYLFVTKLTLSIIKSEFKE